MLHFSEESIIKWILFYYSSIFIPFDKIRQYFYKKSDNINIFKQILNKDHYEKVIFLF